MSGTLLGSIYLYDPTNHMNYVSKIFMSDMSDYFPCMFLVEIHKKKKLNSNEDK